MALCNAYRFFLLIGLLGSFRSDVVYGQDGLTTPATDGNFSTTPGHGNTTEGAIETFTSLQNGTDADTNITSHDTATTALMTSEDLEYVTDLITFSETLSYETEIPAFTDLTTFDLSLTDEITSADVSGTTQEGREHVTDFATTMFNPVTTQLYDNEGTDRSTEVGDTTVLTETDTTEMLTTMLTEYVTDVEDLQVSTLNGDYNDMTTNTLDDEYPTTFTTEVTPFSTTDILTELFSDLQTTDQSTTIIYTEEDETYPDGTLDDVTTYTMNTEMSQNWEDKQKTEIVTVTEDLTTLIEIEGTEDVTTSWPTTDVHSTEMTTIVTELLTEIEMTESTESDDIDNSVTGNTQYTSDVESSTMRTEMTLIEDAEEEEGDDEGEEDMVTEIVFTEEYLTDMTPTDDKMGNESPLLDDLTTDQTTYDDKTKPNDKNILNTNSGLSVTTSFPFTTEVVVLLDNTVSFLMTVDISINIHEKTFIDEMEQNLAQVIQISNTARRKRTVTVVRRTLQRVFRRQRRALNDVITVTVTNLTRQVENPGTVKTTFTVDVNGTTLSATNAATQFNGISESKLSAALGHEVLSIPAPENLPEVALVSLGPLDLPSGDLQDFLMITLLVSLTTDISGAVFQTDVANGLESLYLEGMEMSTTTSRKKRGARVLLDGRIIQIKEEEGLRRRRQAIEDPSEDYAVKLKSVNRPVSTKMEVDIVFCVFMNDQVIKAERALDKLEILPLNFMTTVLGYKVKEPGVTLFKNHESHLLWIIIIADIAVIVILLIILVIYCSCVKQKRADIHKQTILSKADRSTSIEMGFVRIGVQSSGQITTGQTTCKKHKSGAHVMHGTARDKVKRKRHRKQGAFIAEYRLGSDSSDEDSPRDQHLVKPSQIVSHNRVHPDISALVPYSGTEDDYEKQEYVRKFKKRDADEEIRRQQQLQEQLNKEMAARLGAASEEGSSLRSQIGEMLEGATNLNITDRKSKNSHKKKKKKKRRNEDGELLVEDSGSRERTRKKKKTVVLVPTAATKVIPQKKTIQKGNSSTKPAFEDNNNQDLEADQEILYRELCRKWKTERKRLNKFLDEAFIMTTSLLDTSQRIPSPVRPIQTSLEGKEMSPVPANRELPTTRELSINRELSTDQELPPIRQTPLRVAPLLPNPYLYHHSLGVPNYFAVNPSQTQESGPSWSQIYAGQLKEKIQVPLNHPGKSGKERRTKHKVNWTQSLTNPDEKSRHVAPQSGNSIKKRKSRQNKYS